MAESLILGVVLANGVSGRGLGRQERYLDLEIFGMVHLQGMPAEMPSKSFAT